MGFAKIRGKLTTRVGRRVSFGAPLDVQKTGRPASSGTVIDEAWVDPALNASGPRNAQGADDWGDYSFCSQFIRWDDGTHSIRLAYFRRRCGEDHWEFASQTTINADWRTMKALLEATLAKQAWFADMSVPRADGTA